MACYLRGEHIEAERALELRLVSEAHPRAELLAGAEAWCDRASRMPAHALEMAKPLLRSAADASWEEALKLEEFAEANCFSTEPLGKAAETLLRSSPDPVNREPFPSAHPF